MKKPAKAILNRKQAHDEAKSVVDIVLPILQEVVNWATAIFAKATDSAYGQTEEGDGILLLYLHTIEMIDGATRLIASSCIHPAKLLLRSALEADLSIRYMLKADTEQRVLAWRTGEAMKTLSFYEELIDPNMPTPAGLNHLKDYLARPDIAAIERTLWFKDNKKRNTPQHWYQLNKGPSDLGQLAERLKDKESYTVFYKPWSNLLHTNDMSRFIRIRGKKSYKIRDNRELIPVSVNAASLLLLLKYEIIHKFCNEEEVSYARYMATIVPPLDMLQNNASLSS